VRATPLEPRSSRSGAAHGSSSLVVLYHRAPPPPLSPASAVRHQHRRPVSVRAPPPTTPPISPHARALWRSVYVSDSQSSYKLYALKNREFTFDVDVSQLPCGM
jgi:hypothetical protein